VDIVIFLISFGSITLLTGAVVLLVRSVRAASDAGELTVSLGSQGIRRPVSVFDQPAGTTLSSKFDQAFDWLVLESGVGMSPPAVFLGLLASGLLVGGSLLVIYDQPPTAAAGAAVGMVLPLFWLMWKRNRRMSAIREQLPHALELLARAVRAGESVDQAIALLGRETAGALGAEFARCARQMEMGQSMPAVARSLVARIRLLEIRILASTLMVHRQTGGNLAESLDRLAGVVRDRLTYQRQMRASTGAGRTSALVIATVTPLAYLLIFFWQLEHFALLLDDHIGRIMLASAVVLQIVGVVWVARLLQTD
jgi:tight adherence protein B